MSSAAELAEKALGELDALREGLAKKVQDHARAVSAHAAQVIVYILAEVEPPNRFRQLRRAVRLQRAFHRYL